MSRAVLGRASTRNRTPRRSWVLTFLLCAGLALPAALATHGGSLGGGIADGWVDTHGDQMSGDLVMVNGAAVRLDGQPLFSPSPGVLTFGTKIVCMTTNNACVGQQGPQGPEGLVWRGAWSSSESYAVDDAVSHNGASYVAVAANTNSQPPSASWDLLAAKGDTGAQGPAGPANGWADDGAVVRLVTSTDSVGIGTTTPSAKLDIVGGDVRTSGKVITTRVDTTTTQPLEMYVNGARAMRLESGSNVVGGASSNSVHSGKVGGTVGGGASNAVQSDYSTIGGGRGNLVGSPFTTGEGYDVVGGGLNNRAINNRATVGGGEWNNATAGWTTVAGGHKNQATVAYAAVGGGNLNVASGQTATVAGGQSNQATATYVSVGGGFQNRATASAATVPGGYDNQANGAYSFAAGLGARANHANSFVWNDGASFTQLASSASHEFSARATGGVRFFVSTTGAGCTMTAASPTWTCTSDASLKEDFQPVDGRQVLEKVAALPVTTWNLKGFSDVRHMGPTAQDFHAAFGLGESDTRIGAVDADGVALAAIQGLNAKLEEKNAEIEALKARLAALEARAAVAVSEGAPPATGCDEPGEAGHLAFDAEGSRLHVCLGAAGWKLY